MDENNQKQGINRREFLRSILRYSILGGLLSLGGFAIKKPSKEDCDKPVFCQDCPSYTNCELPKAKEIKDERK